MNAPLALDFVVNFTRVSRETEARLQRYHDLLSKWRTRINLVSERSWQDPWRRHFLDSAQLVRHLPAPPASGRHSLIDMGSGAGFPGLVLAMLAADSNVAAPLDVHLVDSDARKCVFLREAARATDTPVTVHNMRLEMSSRDPADSSQTPALPQATLITARGCAPLERLLAMAAPLLAADGQCLFLKGISAIEELTAARKIWNMRCLDAPSVSDPGGMILKISEISRGRPE